MTHTTWQTSKAHHFDVEVRISLKSISNVGCPSIAAAAASPSLSRDGKLPSSTPKN